MPERPLSFALYASRSGLSRSGRQDELIRREVVRARILRIGRLDHAQLHVDDPKVSRMHAVIEVGDDVTLIDLGSESGTLVNGTRINKCTLRPGDRILVGSTLIVFEGDAPLVDERPLRLPTPEIVRAEIGEAFVPDKLFGVAALVLQVDGVRRNAWSDEVELAGPLFDAFPRGAVPPPEVGPDRSYKILDDTVTPRKQRCSTCVLRPGFSPCTVCIGTGAGSLADRMIDPCRACGGEGFLRCQTCDGTTQAVACSVRYINDTPIRVRRALMPNIEPKLKPFVEVHIDPAATWPKAHAFDPEPSLVGTAYRGSSAVRATSDFHGFFFGDAIAACLAAREEASSGLARFTAHAFAVPVLWTVTGERHAAYFFDAFGALRQVGGNSPQDG